MRQIHSSISRKQKHNSLYELDLNNDDLSLQIKNYFRKQWSSKVTCTAKGKIMTQREKFQFVIVPALIFIGLGILSLKYPHALEGFDDNYTGHGWAGFIMLIIELFLIFT